MKIVLDDKECVKHNLNIPSVLTILLVKTGENIPMLIEDLIKKEVLVRVGERIAVTQRWDELCESILLSSETSNISNDDLEQLALELMAVVPQEKKEGTPYFFKCNKREVTQKLKKFFKLYGTYSKEDILEVTRKYYQSFNGNYTMAKLLKYFIMKDEKRINEEGMPYIEETSLLGTYLENKSVKEYNTNEELI